MKQRTRIILEIIVILVVVFIIFIFRIDKYRLPGESRVANLVAYTKNKTNETFHKPEKDKKYFGLSKQSFIEINKLDNLTKEGIPEEFDKKIRKTLKNVGTKQDQEMARRLMVFKVKTRQMDFIEIGPDYKKKIGREDGSIVFRACKNYWSDNFNYKDFKSEVYESSSDIHTLELVRDRHYFGMVHSIDMTKQECEAVINSFLKKEVILQ